MSTWTQIFETPTALEAALPEYLRARRWFRGKSRRLVGVTVADVAELPHADARIVFVEAALEGGAGAARETYVLPLAFAAGDEAARLRAEQPNMIVAPLGEGVLFDAVARTGFLAALLELFSRGGPLATRQGEVRIDALPGYRAALDGARLDPSPIRGEQTNTSIVFGDTFLLKLVRRMDEGVSADLEVGQFLTEVAGFRSSPPVVGSLEYRMRSGRVATLGILQRFVKNEGDAWDFTLKSLRRYFEDPRELGERYLPLVRLLGKRTAEMHLALATPSDDAAFAPEAFTLDAQRALVTAAREGLARTFATLRRQEPGLAEDVRGQVGALLRREDEIARRLERVAAVPLEAMRTRIHGDYHLGQVLFTGDDFMIIDFEGEPARPMAERKAKRSPLADVAGMVRSLHYAALGSLRLDGGDAGAAAARTPKARAWYAAVASAYREAYFATLGASPLVPKGEDALRTMIDFYLFEKCIYEVGYEVDNRPDWLAIPIEGLTELLGDTK